MTVDATVARIADENGNTWAIIKYRGMMEFHGINSAVFDYVMATPSASRQQRVVSGFSIVDIRTMMPLLLVLDAGSEMQLIQTSQTSCLK